MKKLSYLFLISFLSIRLFAQQVPNAGFENWGGTAFDGHAQPTSWHASNVTQFGFKFNFAHQESGHTGSYSMMVQDQDVGAAGITETSPGYVSLGEPWVYVESLTKVSEASAGTYGGINWSYLPDTMVVWVKRTGNNTDKEDFHLLYYSWYGTAQSSKYKGKNGNCTSVSKTDEESDIRQSTDGNECGTDTKATQVAEGWWHERATYGTWTQIKVPIYYMSNSAPEKMNIIFSASNYPNFRANSGLYSGNSLYVDDVEMIYSSRIQHLYIGGKEWLAFDPNSSEEQVYSLGQNATTIPAIVARRGEGQLTNSKGVTTSFPGRELGASEINIVNGTIDGSPTVITVTAPDGSSTTTYRIKFVREASHNPYLSAIQCNGIDIPGFNPQNTSYVVSLPYGTTQAPVITATPQEETQTIQINQASSLQGTATITVTAADQTTTVTYMLTFQVALLSDNTLQDILVNGNSVPGFSPSTTNYRVSLPLGTTVMPLVQAVSKYPAGEQTIVYTAPSEIDGGVYQIAVTTPGNPMPKTYKLNFKLEASSYSLLADLKVDGVSLPDFSPSQYTYYVTLPIGTTELPSITWEQGDAYQSVELTTAGIDGTTRVTVTAANGEQTVYKIIFTTLKSEISTLDMIYLDGDSLSGFSSDITAYHIELPVGTTSLPVITYDMSDEYETVTMMTGSVNGTTRLTVMAGNGNTTVYQLTFSVRQATDASLRMIYLDGDSLPGFDPELTEYWVNLPQGTTVLPEVTYTQADEWQTVSARSGGLNGDYRLTVRPQNGASRTYIIHFSVATSSNVNLLMIYLDGQPLTGFDPEILNYVDTLPAGQSTIPTVTYTKAENGQKVLSVVEGYTQTIKVTAENGAIRIYTIVFVVQKSESAYLKMIYLDGDSLPGFEPANLVYDSLILATSSCPVITVDKEEGQQVTITSPASAGTARIRVTPESGAYNTYVLHFIDTTSSHSSYSHDTVPAPYIMSGDCSLNNILLDGVGLNGFVSSQLNYSIQLPAGSDIPVVTYVRNTNLQSVVFGFSDRNHCNMFVTAENGDTATYHVSFVVEQYHNAQLVSMSLADRTLAFDPDIYEYHERIDAGVALPDLSVVAREGQTTMMVTENDTIQKVIVTAEDGTQNTYIIYYTRVLSANALLQDILLNGVSLNGFAADKHDYIDTLAWRTAVVPAVHPVGQHQDQVITTNHSRINGTTTIHVEAPDGITTTDYTIQFPVRKSSNLALEYIMIDHETVSINYRPEQTDYAFLLPLGDTIVPQIQYGEGEPEQTVEFVSRPLGQTSQIVVTAENGDQRTYNLFFDVEKQSLPNRLASLSIAEIDYTISLKDKNQRTFTVDMPYGSRSFTVEYTKSYPEQTVFVQPGGVNNPTVLTVKANVDGVADEVYTVIPVVPTADPAVLTDIMVNGVSIDGFNSEQFSYIVNVSARPVIRYTLNKGAEINILDQTSKHWSAEVSYGDRTNVYNVWYYYPDEYVPNAEFTEWTTCDVYSDANKPVGWNTIGDALGKHNIIIIGSFTPDALIEKSGTDAVKLTTAYSNPGGGAIPGFITLGKVHGSWGVAGSSSFDISGGISFHNSPDIMQIRYYSTTVKNNSLIQYTLVGSNGESTLEWKDTETSSNYKVVDFDLSAANVAAGDPTLLNIVLDSYYQVSGTITAATTPQMYIDYVRMFYNHELVSMTVNGVEAIRTDDAFEYVLDDPEQIELPVLSFNGEVLDQAPVVTWSAETLDGANAVRTASIRNFAENGIDYSDYTLSVVRPLCQKNQLSQLYVNGTLLKNFVPATTDYTIHLNSSVHSLPDIVPVMASSRQTITTAYSDSVFSITVTPEYGNSTIYTIRMVTDLSSDVTLQDIVAEGVEYNPAQNDYVIEADKMPSISFIKNMDKQVVEQIAVNDQLTHIVVTAENGSQGVYTITLNMLAPESTGLLSELELNGNVPADFHNTTYTYEKERPSSTVFRRENNLDSVVFIQTGTYMEWQVYGAESHAYRLTYPTDPSHIANLAAIYVDGTPLEEFSSAVTEYTIYSDSAVQLQAVGTDERQHISIVRPEGDNTYTITVTAEDATTQMIYTVNLMPNQSDNAYLSDISLDGVTIPAFRQDSLNYLIVLPAGSSKQRQPMMPSLSYVLAEPSQKAQVEYGILGEPTYINVTAGDGLTSALYSVLIEAEPSHNAELSAIYVNGTALDHFEAGRHYYSLQVQTDEVEITWQTVDSFQTITELAGENNERIIRVVAEDGTTTTDYTIDLFVEAQSSDATLRMILLDGEEFKHFQYMINPRLDFSPMRNRYSINLPSGSTVLPEVSAQLSMDGQIVDVRIEGMTVYLDVTARDGVTTNTYSLEFFTPLSSNAHLQAIFLDGEEMAGFDRETTYYLVNLPVGTHSLPEIYGLKEETTQSVASPVMADNKAVILVTAEDGTQLRYTLQFVFLQSDQDQLLDLYLDGVEIADFRPDTFFYAVDLPVGTVAFPEVSWEAGDEWQTVSSSVIRQSADNQVVQVNVIAESGRKNIYTVEFSILKSVVDTLQMIYIDNRPLAGFDPYQSVYYYTVPAGASEIPDFYFISGDEYQTVTSVVLPDTMLMKSLGVRLDIVATAQTGAQRTYTVHFPMTLSDEVALNMIWYDGTNLANYDEGVLNYRVVLPYGTEHLGNITVTKKEDAQNVDIIVEGDSLCTINVLAEDGVSTQTYTIRFTRALSPYALLDMISLNGVDIPTFVPDSFEYDVVLEKGESLPAISWLKGEEMQSVSVDSVSVEMDGRRYVNYLLMVTSADGENMVEYIISFTYRLSDFTALNTIMVKGLPVSMDENFDADFAPDLLTYTKFYPIGSDSTAFFTADDVSYQLGDQYQTAEIRQDDPSTISIKVIAENGEDYRMYILRQEIILSSNCLVEMIYLDGKPFYAFDSLTYSYTYYLYEGQTVPQITFDPVDSFSIAYPVTPGEIEVAPWIIICEAQDGTTAYYEINFVYSPINTADKPYEGDVLVQRIPGTSQVAFASLRKNVSVAVYDRSGQMIYYQALEESDPNNIVVEADGNGRDCFTHVRDYSQCPTLKLELNTVYIYCFFENDKERIKAGKLMITY